MPHMDQSTSSEHQATRGHPLGPVMMRLEHKATSYTRLWALVLGLICFGLLAVAWTLSPDARGLGTHRQLGLAPCSLVMMTGYPCPTCGMTTAFSHAVRGEVILAFYAQPTGLLAALMVFVVGVVAMTAALTGRMWRINWFRVSPFQLGLVCVALVLAGWGYKVVAMVLLR